MEMDVELRCPIFRESQSARRLGISGTVADKRDDIGNDLPRAITAVWIDALANVESQP